MLTMYPAILYKDGNAYTVIFPDLNYLSTCGSDVNEAMEMAVDCLAGYIHVCKCDSDTIPSPSQITEVDPDKTAKDLGFDNSGAFVTMVAVDVEEYEQSHFKETIEKSISIPLWLNDRAVAKGVNFSALLQDALKTQLGITGR